MRDHVGPSFGIGCYGTRVESEGDLPMLQDWIS
jgi:hypothetical protein